MDCIVRARGLSNRPLLRKQASRNTSMSGLNDTFVEGCCGSWGGIWNMDIPRICAQNVVFVMLEHFVHTRPRHCAPKLLY